MRIDLLTIFPDYLAPLELSLIGKARAAGHLQVTVHDLRAFTADRHRTVDDTPYGGGAGMVMRPEPWGQALDHLLGAGPDGPVAPEEPARASAGDVVVVVPTPSGEPFTQEIAAQISLVPHLVLLCGRYEGIDRRVVEEVGARWPVRELSIGDYVLAGGEAAALVMVEAVTRLLPGVLGNADSLAEESHVGGLLEYPVYTKPPVWRGRAVPEVLLSGDHGRVAAWRREQALARTATMRPDLVARLDSTQLGPADLALLDDLGWEPDPVGGFRRKALPVAD